MKRFGMLALALSLMVFVLPLLAQDSGVVYIQPGTGGTYNSPGTFTVGTGYAGTGCTITPAGALSTDGLIIGDNGITIVGGNASINASSNYAFYACTGTSTGLVDIGGTGTQTLNFGAGAGAKTVNVGSATGASVTTVRSGTGGLVLSSTNDASLTATDDVTVNGGSAGSIITIGGNTDGNVLNVATDDTTADQVNVGSAKDAVNITGATVHLHMGTGGAASCVGTATLTSGTVTVSTTCVDTNSKIFVTIGTPTADTHTISVPAASIVDGTSFVINGLIDNATVNGADNTTTVNWFIVNPN